MFEWLQFWKRSARKPAGRLRPADAPEGDDPTAPLPRELRGPVAKLGHRETWVRRSAAEELGRLGPAARPAIPALIAAACDIEGPVRSVAVAALGQIDPDWVATAEAREAVPALVKALGSRFAEVWETASGLLVKIGPSAVSELSDALFDRWQDTRQVAIARTLGRIGPAAADAVPALARELVSEHPNVRQAAADALGAIGPAAANAVPGLVLLLTDKLPTCRQSASRALARVAPTDPSAIPPLVQVFTDRAEEVREAAIDSLGRIGPTVVPHVVELLQAADSRCMEERLREKVRAIDWSGGRTKGEDIRREPVKVLRDANWCFAHAVVENQRLEIAREAAVRVLGLIGPGAADGVSVLSAALADKNRRVRQAAAKSLGQLGPAARPALPAVVKALADVDIVRKAAADSLPRIDPDWATCPDIAGTLIELAVELKKTGEYGQAAADALVAVGPSAVPAIIGALSFDDRIAREAAANTLGRMGPAARDAVPALRTALQDPHAWVREAAEKALRAIDPTRAEK